MFIDANMDDLGSNSNDDDDAIDVYGYRRMIPPVQDNETFSTLIAVANADGMVYVGKGKEKEVADRDISSTSPSPAVTAAMMENAPALFVSVECPGRDDGHAIFRAQRCAGTEEYQPFTALYFYQSLRFSSNLQVEFINDLVDQMRPEEIRLGTARKPVYIDEKHLFGRPSTGFHHLGYLEELDPGVVIKPVVDDEVKRGLLQMNNLDENLDMYVLYIWTVVSPKVDHR
jgi:hypothetical protein